MAIIPVHSPVLAIPFFLSILKCSSPIPSRKMSSNSSFGDGVFDTGKEVYETYTNCIALVLGVSSFNKQTRNNLYYNNCTYHCINILVDYQDIRRIK